MSATVTAALAGRTGPLRSTVTRLAAVNLTLLVWFWACSVPVVVVASILVDRLLGVDDVAVSLYTRHAAIWFPFSQGIALVGLFLRAHVAAGMTRRTFARATILVGVGTGAAYGVVLTLLAVAERGIHTALGRGWRVTDGFLADESSPLGLLLAEVVVCCVVGNVAALLVGVVYQRWGALYGTLALPLTVGPVFLVFALLGAAGGWGPLPAAAPGPPWPALGWSVLVVALTAAAYAAVVRRTQLRPPHP
ncbi:hypothetical protein J1G44_03750 [Cellulomonas sp. zg-ZUI199]|uniref:ABC transporter permease n=1 Tax=Cellulomonas wangleii TaxID=2816956 RepID=A0ABX8D3B1_9CELL|nr:hypothetical protein [Cellulomonas wangleii]MBO0923594.1 hypothetical protein [Cellulomonas wangleii]QVI61918.1 hypothetical protein KG103_16035 [Cellulomonas wangleii]